MHSNLRPSHTNTILYSCRFSNAWRNQCNGDVRGAVGVGCWEACSPAHSGWPFGVGWKCKGNSTSPIGHLQSLTSLYSSRRENSTFRSYAQNQRAFITVVEVVCLFFCWFVGQKVKQFYAATSKEKLKTPQFCSCVHTCLVYTNTCAFCGSVIDSCRIASESKQAKKQKSMWGGIMEMQLKRSLRCSCDSVRTAC